MRSPHRIAPFLAALQAVWEMNPDMRFGQLVMNLSRDGDGFADTWEWEDGRWYKRMNDYFADALTTSTAAQGGAHPEVEVQTNSKQDQDLEVEVARLRVECDAANARGEANRLALQNAQGVLLNGLPGVDSFADRINAADDIISKALTRAAEETL